MANPTSHLKAIALNIAEPTSPSTVLLEIWLPLPPTLNTIWRVARETFHKSKKYKLWMDECDAIWLCTKPRIKTINYPFAASVLLFAPDRRKRDLDNIAFKAIGDWLKHAGIVSDDCLCRKLTAEWSEVISSQGCRLILHSL